MTEQQKQNWDYVEWNILTAFLPALINADTTELSDEDENLLHDFEQEAFKEYGLGHWSYDQETTESFTRCELTNLHGETITVRYNFIEES